ncbi:MAG: hypothetical protein HFE75_04950 [Firmicutes bacterium]|jgi:hypothetical protein|nr:hypothetical protein [Bacillota bacterium]
MLTERIAEALGKSAQTIRVGLQLGKYPFGMAHKNPGANNFIYTYFPPKVKEYVGIDIGPMDKITEEEQ